ncbi:Acetyltransferase (GNAT) family protein [Bryocella elongata]|uniref:Acetyltransferase (GNAT) family protein n=2 Tax=Bryocella elongata TaxID=863522 RepID=A0A1H5WG74_9BACT|nr:Acetyltransferase (GNAT) family protein [Bryocella elongata]
MSPGSQMEILDLRHFSAAQLRPLLRDEASQWQRRLHWNYTQSTDLLLEYLDSRILPGVVAYSSKRVIGYAFAVYEAAKAVIGDVYAFTETGSQINPICDNMLMHLIEILEATPAVDRIESQLLMFPAGSLHTPFLSRGFQAHPRLFMLCDLAQSPLGKQFVPPPVPAGIYLEPWRTSFTTQAAQLIHRCYEGHTDASINDQYRTLHGAERFLHNIIRFPGCGVFDADNSWLLLDAASANGIPRIEAMVLSSRVDHDAGHITQLCVAPGARHKGLGRFLLQQVASVLLRRRYTALSLTVTESNGPARQLYEGLGFQAWHRFEAMVWEKPGN